jgi:hypothetical protein
MTHKSLVSSNLEYCSTISPHTKKTEKQNIKDSTQSSQQVDCIPKDNCTREEAEFEVVSGCAEGLVSKTDCVV